MDLTNVALTKLGSKEGRLYKLLKEAKPDKQFTRSDEIMVTFVFPELKTPSGLNHQEEVRLNFEKINEVTAKVVKIAVRPTLDVASAQGLSKNAGSGRLRILSTTLANTGVT